MILEKKGHKGLVGGGIWGVLGVFTAASVMVVAL